MLRVNLLTGSQDAVKPTALFTGLKQMKTTELCPGRITGGISSGY